MISADNTMSIRNLLKNNWIKALIILLPCLLFLVLLIIFSGNYLILGGEGNYFTNFQLTRDIGSYSWGPTLQGVGFPNPTLNGLVGVFDFFLLLQKLGVSLKTVNIVIAFLVYILPFLSILWLLNKILKVEFVISFMLSLFYLLNPFSTFHLQNLMFWNTAPFFVLPLIFGSIYKYYFYKLKLFFVFGLLTAILAFSFSNIPYLGVFHIFLVISLVIIHYMRLEDRSNGVGYWLMIKNFFILETSFILFNAWWLTNLIRFQMQDVSSYYTKSFAVGWGSYAIGDGGIMGKIFSLKTLIPLGRNNFFSDFYNSSPMIIILIIPFLLIIWNLFINANDQKNSRVRKHNLIVVFFVLLVFFLNKGANEPLRSVYVWMLNNVPFFIIFKSPLEKFSVLLVFLLTLSLVLIFRNIKNKWPYYLISVYLIACAIPYVTLNFMPEYKMENFKYISKKYQYKESNFSASKFLNMNKLDYRSLSLPGSLNYQVTVLNHDGNKYYRGMDPFIYAVNKSFIAAYTSPTSNLDYIFTNFSNTSVEENLLNIYNIKRIVIDKDIYPSFGFREKEDTQKLTNIFDKNTKKQSFDSINIFSRSDFLPHFYVPEQNIVTGENVDSLVKIATESGRLTRPAFYFSKQNKNSGLDSLKKVTSGTQTLEFKKINPTKYRIVVHGAKGEFPLVFSESFHDGWKSYLTEIASSSRQSGTPRNDMLGKYKILDGNGDDQASSEELKSFIDKGWITTLGDEKEREIIHQKWDSTRNVWQGNQVFDYSEKYSMDFISKNFQGTIQNDNLPSGQFYETWFKKPIEDNKNHLMVNGYANNWFINTDKLCSVQNNCIKNADGSYDFEVVVEFWPQRLYYLGLFISGTTLIGCLSYLFLSWVRGKGRERGDEEFTFQKLRVK